MIDKVILHCSDSPNGRDDKIEDIDRWHKAKGWNGCGYHYVIEISGNIAKGREEGKTGAHCPPFNRTSIGICLIGKDVFNTNQAESLVQLLQEIILRYPEITIHGHNEFSSKSCPNFDVKEFCKTFNL